MYRLILMRHAKSAYPPGVPDHDRPLNGRGQVDADRIADRLRQFLPSDASVSAAVSTAERAQRTWHFVQARLPIPSWTDRTLYLAEPTAILEVASAMVSDVGIVVGHNPGLELLARSARGADQALDTRTNHRLMEKFPTSAFAVLECASGDWTRPELSCAGFVVCR